MKRNSAGLFRETADDSVVLDRMVNPTMGGWNFGVSYVPPPETVPQGRETVHADFQDFKKRCIPMYPPPQNFCADSFGGIACVVPRMKRQKEEAPQPEPRKRQCTGFAPEIETHMVADSEQFHQPMHSRQPDTSSSTMSDDTPLCDSPMCGGQEDTLGSAFVDELWQQYHQQGLMW
eukprot:CAMPEP_0181319388 /NCGR_PEP_ID=MMETSP1101-20121128/17542_1 /TAXON_ID=46948 /ORGANISM="Rhodomonas abbreviata, Strain Caron Lab Isolate" /LENGTH=175 /DNA_ID=CAMNT_0023426979 /DNA_START=66 /DNA_END=590 /DNA_ORIENTATION=+